jgi:uncharacterized YigZ family protein
MPFCLAGPVHSELLIRKSRFIGCVEPIQDRHASRNRILALREAHPGAAHVCWAMLAGGQSAANDDGEPSGTAGRPIFEVLRHQDLEGVLASVVRYFGGIRLGAGGLVRAYTDTIAQALQAAQKIPFERRVQLGCRLPYPLEGMLRRELATAGARLIGADHQTQVEVRFELPEPDRSALIVRINEIGQGLIEWIDVDIDIDLDVMAERGTEVG